MRNEGRDADTGKPTPLPTVTTDLVQTAVRAGLLPTLFIDEFDKIKTRQCLSVERVLIHHRRYSVEQRTGCRVHEPIGHGTEVRPW